MSVYTPHFAPIVVLAFLGTAFMVVLSFLIAAVAALRKAWKVALASLVAGLGIVLIYGTILVGFSLSSRDSAIVSGGWKYFCEIDCHIAYSVGNVQTISASLGELHDQALPEKFVIVQLRTWFDPATISPHRGNGLLTPSERKIRLVDSAGHEFLESPQAESLLAVRGLHSTPLRTPLRPGESYVSYLVFATPNETRSFGLVVTSAEELDAVLWGHEISPFHGKAYFSIHV
jgi:hypothetical protein